jgi:hypothetical protein
MTLEEIYYSEKISVRSFNVCNKNDLNDLNTILKHYRTYNTFDNLRNCGRKSNEELISVCLKYIKYESIGLIEPVRPNEQIITKINSFTRTQREVVNSFIQISTNALSNHVLASFLNGNIKIRDISVRILSNEFSDFFDLKNVEVKTIGELKAFYLSIINFIEKVAEIKDENELIALRNRTFIEKLFSITSIHDELISPQSTFSLVAFLISNNAIFDKKENTVFLNAFKIFNHRGAFTIDEIANELHISRERVRQRRKGILENIISNFYFLRYLDNNLYQKYNLDENQQLINVDDTLNEMINQINKTNFTKEFNSILIYSCVSDKYGLLGNIEDVLQPKVCYSKDRHYWCNFYLVQQELFDFFDFNGFVDDLSKRLNEKNEVSYSLNFKSYLSNFLHGNDYNLTTLILPVAETIINIEFELMIDLEDNVFFKRNIIKKNYEYAIEALEMLAVPSHIEKIYELVKNNFPQITKSKESFRACLLRTPEVICFGRSSVYGLKKWEIEKDGIKGGTIKGIIFDYLIDKDQPVHILELVYEVHKYRKQTNAKNILTNLKVDPQNQFVVFKQGFVGLSSKFYDSELIRLPKHLGKTISHFVKKQNIISRNQLEEYFSKKLGISIENMKYIVEYLIDGKYIYINGHNYLRA